MAYFHAPKKRVIATCALTVMIIVFILVFRLIPQPWKGLLDFGVVFGLAWGMSLQLYISALKLLQMKPLAWDNEVLVAS